MSKEKKNKMVPKLRFPEFNDEWEVKALGEIGNFIGGGTPDTLKPEYWDGEIQWFTPTEVKDRNLEKSKRTITEEGLKNSSAKLLPIGTLLITTRATIGDVGIASSECTTNQGFQSLIVNSNEVNTFWYYWLIQNKGELVRKSSGSTFPEIGKNEIIKVKALRPNKKEQQKIADCISSLDVLITAESQKLEALQAHKKGLMQQLFPAEGETVPKLRFKEFKSSGEWSANAIGDFIESYKGGAPLTPSDFVPYSNCEVIPKKAINEGMCLNLDAKNPTYCSDDFYENNPQSIVDSTYLITTLRDLVPSGPSIGYIVKYNGTKKYLLAQGVYGLKPKSTIVPEFLIHFSNSKLYRKLVNAVMVGSTQVHIRNSVFLQLPIKVPSFKEQQKIAACLSSLDELITAQAEKIEELKRHKKGLMQGLFPSINLPSQ